MLWRNNVTKKGEFKCFLVRKFVKVFLFIFQAIAAPYDRVFPAEKDSEKDVEGNCKFGLNIFVFSPLERARLYLLQQV